MTKYIVAHDVGTSSDKAVLVDLQGGVCGKVIALYETKYPRPGWAEQDPENWWTAVARSTGQLLQVKGIPPSDIICLVFSTQMLGIVPVGANSRPLRPAIIWLDNRAAAEADWVMGKFLGPTIFGAIAGNTLGGKDGIPKLVWLKKHEPEIYNAMACFLDVNGYLVYRCTGRQGMDWSNASTVGFDLQKKTWPSGIFKYEGIDPAKLPPLVRPTDKVGILTGEAASKLGLIEGTPVMGGAGDVPAAAVGSGAVLDGEGHISMGTSAWVGVATGKSLSGKNGIAIIQSADPARNLLVAETELAGGCLTWAGKHLCKSEIAEHGPGSIYTVMDKIVDGVPAGSGLLIFMPWMYGERAPVFDTYIRSGFVNLAPGHTRDHMLRAVYEGVAYNMRWIMERVEKEYKFALPSARVIGGGALGSPWMQILADVTGRKIERVQNPQEAGAVGAAMTAAVGLGIHKDFASPNSVVGIDRTFEPQDRNGEVYELLYSAYKGLYPALKSYYARVNADRLH